MALSREEIQGLYRKRAGRYDLTANLYYLIGFREQHYRRRAVAALGLQRGDAVVELGCGTGLNFPLLQGMVGPTGKIIGVDLTDQMLAQAEQRIARYGWQNVELVRTDANSFIYPKGVRGILSTFALTLMPDFDRIIRIGRDALAAGGRFVILDFKQPENVPFWLTRLMAWISSPFGVSLDLAQRHPWESVEKGFSSTWRKEFFFGFVYLVVGMAGDSVGQCHPGF